ncbi:MAG: hypothetical protein ACJ0DD_02330 [Paracoccaceae bacterium]
MSNKQKKANNSTSSINKKQTNEPLSISKSGANKKDLINKIEKIGNFVSKEMHKYEEDNLGSNSILYLKSDQLVSKDLEKDLGTIEINLKELKKIIRDIVIEEIEKKGLN